MRACLCIYDIPDRCKLTNPISTLRRVGTRINLSCWIIPEERVPYDYFQELKAGGASVEVVRFDESEYAKLRSLARAALERESSACYESLLQSLEAAKTAYRQADPEPNGTDPREKLEKRVKAILAQARRKLIDAESAAVGFQLTQDLQTVFAGIREAIQAKDAAFRAWQSQGPLFANGVANAS